MKKWLLFLLCSALVVNLLVAQTRVIELSLQKEAEHAILFGLQWLEKHQEQDGSWSHYPAITALVVTAFLNSPHGYTESNSIAVGKGVDFIVGCQQPNGGIFVDDLAGYNTAICIMALVATNNPKYEENIRRARDFLLTLQFDESDGITKSDLRFGGIGYREKERPDLSNLQWAIEALKVSEQYRKVEEASGKPREYSGEGKTQLVSASKELFWDNALIFIQRCQNLKAYNDQPWAGNDGGFIYSTSESKAGGYTSYGSMTYAGMKSFIYAGLNRDDRRVQAAFEWVKKNFTVEKNPELGEQGLFYYYQTMAKALAIYGEDYIVDPTGKKHNWREELLKQLLKIQHGEGYWVNTNNRWWENQKELVTAYAILAIEHCLK
jgi:squalene-hopene/tetraprenyl-beta-curcumene cyclase